MNQSPNPAGQPNTVRLFREKNPWTSLDPLPRLAPLTSILLSLFLIACAAFQPYAFSLPVYSVALLLACLVYFFRIARSPFAIVSALAVFAAGYLAGLLIDYQAAALYGVFALAQLCVIGVGAALICTCRSRWLAVIPFAVYGLSYLLCGDALLAVFPLLMLPAAGILAFATMRNLPRVPVICLTSCIAGVCAAFALALLWYRANGAISLSAVVEAVDAYRVSVTDAMTAYLKDYFSVLPNPPASLTENITAFTESLVNLIFTLSPALAITLVNLLAYSAQILCVQSFRGLKIPSFTTVSAQIFAMSTPSAILYLIATLLSLFISDASLFGATVENFRLVLLPGMCIVGFWKLMSDLHRRRSPGWFFILLIVATFLLPGVVFFCLSVSGAVTTLVRPLIARMIAEGKFPPDDPNAPPQDKP